MSVKSSPFSGAEATVSYCIDIANVRWQMWRGGPTGELLEEVAGLDGCSDRTLVESSVVVAYLVYRGVPCFSKATNSVNLCFRHL
jgi:hypothetical protein